MAQVIHIEGLGTEPIWPPIYIEPGTSLLDLVRRFGGTIRVEQVPDQPKPPRELDPRAVRFLADYEPEEAGSVLALFWRYHSLEVEEFDTRDEAALFLLSGADYDSLAGEAIIDGDRIEVLP